MTTPILMGALPCLLPLDYNDALGVDCDQAAGDVGVFVVPQKCTVVHAACCVTEVCAGSTSTPVVKFDLRPTAGADTGRGDGNAGSFALGTSAAGTFMYDKDVQGLELSPGDEVVVQLVTAAVGTPTGHFHPVLYVEFSTNPVQDAADAVATA